MFFPGLFFILFSHFCVGVGVLGLGLRLGFLGFSVDSFEACGVGL